ncbi:MAG: protein kinase, partial [Myxococcota bacterium]
MTVPTASPGQRIGGWTLQSPLGEGSFGSAWRAADDRGRLASLKLLGGPPGAEVLALSRVCHPAVPMVLDAQGGAKPYLAMSLARGRSLSSMIQTAAAPEPAAVAIAAILADALAAVHAAGVVHGDVKPDNVVVGSVGRGEVCLVDFGMSGVEQGGTYAYAAPERLRGGAASAEADVYALGLVLWEMLFKGLPWSEVGLSASLSRRLEAAPVAENSSPWLAELLGSLLAPAPADRPSASAAADVFAAHGAALPAVTPELIRRRARTIQVARPEAEAALEQWRERGGVLALVGEHGSGRSHLLDRQSTALQAQGAAWVRLNSVNRAWGAIEVALQSPSLPGPSVGLPTSLDLAERAERCAQLLEERAPDGFVIIVDDIEHLDEGSQTALKALARRGTASMLIAGETAPRWAGTPLELEPFTAEATAELVTGLLGAPMPELSQVVHETCDGAPGLAVAFLALACQEGALLRRARRWLVDPQQLKALAARQHREAAITLRSDRLPAKVGGVIAVSRVPVPRSALPALVEAGAEAVQDAVAELVELGLVRQEHGRLSASGSAAANTLVAACPDLQAVNRRLADDMGRTDASRGWYVVGARDVDTARTHGAALVEACRRQDPFDGAQLAEAMWALAPSPALAAARIDALRIAGRLEQAVFFGEGVIRTMPSMEGWIALARVYLSRDDRALEARLAAKRARAMGATGLALALVEARACIAEHKPAEARTTSSVALTMEPPDTVEALDDWLGLWGVYVQALYATGRLNEAIAVLDTFPDEVGIGRPERALLEGIRGRLLWHAGQFSRAAQAMERAAAADAGLAATDRAKMLNNAGLIFYQTGSRLDALARWEESLLLFERLGDDREQLRVSINLCVGYREVGRWERARQAGLWAFERGRQAGEVAFQAMAAGNLGDLAYDQEQIVEARRWYEQARPLAEAEGLESELVELDRRQATLAVRSRAVDAMDTVKAALARARAANEAVEVCRCEALLAICQARAGAHQEALGLLDGAMSAMREAGAAGELAHLRLQAAETYLILNQLREAAQECERVIAYASELNLGPMRARAKRLLQQAAAPQNAEEIARRLEQLVSLAVRMTQVTQEAPLLKAIARSARELLDGDRAFVVLVDGGAQRIAARDGDGDAPPSQSVIDRVLRGRRGHRGGSARAGGSAGG